MADVQIRVGSATPVAQLASAIANRIYEQHTVVLQMIGAAAVSQAVKAIAVASVFTGTAADVTLSAKPSIEDVAGTDGPVTRILIRVFPDQPGTVSLPHGYTRQPGAGDRVHPRSR